MARTVTTAWGQAEVLEEVVLPQGSHEREFAAIVQLLSGPDEERYVRFAYTTGGTARRGPVTLRDADVARLRAELVERPGLAAALGLAAPEKRGGGRPGRRK